MTLERLRHRRLQLLHPLIRTSHSSPVQLRKRRNIDLCLDNGVVAVALVAGAAFAGTGDRADYGSVAGGDEGGAVGGGLRGDAGGEFAEFVPASAVKAEEGRGVGGGCVEGHREDRALGEDGDEIGGSLEGLRGSCDQIEQSAVPVTGNRAVGFGDEESVVFPNKEFCL